MSVSCPGEVVDDRSKIRPHIEVNLDLVEKNDVQDDGIYGKALPHSHAGIIVTLACRRFPLLQDRQKGQ
jgi:hypothetical protein